MKVWLLCAVVGLRAALHTDRTRTGRSTGHVQWQRPGTDKCLAHYGGLEFNYTQGSKTAFTFDLCHVINCGSNQRGWSGYDVYLCWFTWGAPTNNPWCPYWSDVLVSSDPGWSRQARTYNGTDLTSHLNIWRKQLDNSAPGNNPMTFSISNLLSNPWPRRVQSSSWCWSPGTDGDAVYFILGVDHSGKDTMGLVKVNFVKPSSPSPSPTPIAATATNTTPPTVMGSVKQPSPQNVTLVSVNADGTMVQGQMPPGPTQQLAVVTGYSDRNTWLDWIVATALSLNMSNCVACSSARPTLFTVPAPLFPSDAAGYYCMLAITMFEKPANCNTISAIFPPVRNNTIPPVFTPTQGNYSCFTRYNTSAT